MCSSFRSSPALGMIPPDQFEQPLGRMRALPFAGGVLVGFRHGRIGVDRPQYLAQAQVVLNPRHIFVDQLAPLLPNNRTPKYPVFPGPPTNLNEPRDPSFGKLGRASCGERVFIYVYI